MKKMITVLAVALAFSSANAAPGKGKTTALDALRAKDNKTTAETKKSAADTKQRGETETALGEIGRASAIETLSKTDAKLREDAIKLSNDAKAGRITVEHKNVTLDLLLNIAKSDRAASDNMFKFGAGSDPVDARGALMSLANGLLTQVKGDKGRSAVAIKGAKAAIEVLAKEPGNFVAADVAARKIISKETGKEVTREQMKESCKRA